VARFVQRAVARQVSTSQFLSNLVDRDVETSGKQVDAVAADRLLSSEVERVRIAPLRRPRHDNGARRQAEALPTRSLQTLRHTQSVSGIAPLAMYRTRMDLAIQGGLSPPRLPVSPPGRVCITRRRPR